MKSLVLILSMINACADQSESQVTTGQVNAGEESFDELRPTEGRQAEYADQFTQMWQEESDYPLSLGGRLMISVRPHARSPYASTHLLVPGGDCPKVMKAQLPLKETISGTILASLDLGSDLESISAKSWLLIEAPGGGRDTFSDENPFSSTQQLFTLGRFNSALDGTLILKELSLYTEPSALPPYVFDPLTQTSFSLSLPPISSLEELEVKVYRDLNEQSALGRARLSLWSGDQLISTVGETDRAGEGRVSFWGGVIDQLDLSEVTLRIKPSPESQLPVLIKNMNLLDLSEEAVEIATPRLGTIKNVNVDIDLNADQIVEGTNEVWRLVLSQSWASELEFDLNTPQGFDGRRAAAIRSEVYAIQPGTPQTLGFYPTRVVLFLLPPNQSLERAQRIEVEAIDESNTLRLSSVPKPLVRGQVRDREDRAVEAKVVFTQLAWPWRDAQNIPLGFFQTQTDGQGGFSIAVDPGVYAVSYQPNSEQLSPQVILLNVPEAEGLLIAPSQALLSSGESLSLLASDGDRTRPLPIGGRVKLDCIISSLDPIFAGSSMTNDSSRPLRVPLSSGMTREGIYKIRLQSESCPVWPSEMIEEFERE